MNSEKISKFIFFGTIIFVLCALSYAYGVISLRANLPPVPQLKATISMVRDVFVRSDAILDTTGEIPDEPIQTFIPEALQPGLILVARNINHRQTHVDIIDREGRVVHSWKPVFSEIWPDGEGNFRERPNQGMYLHGIDILPDGSIVANFEHQSTFRLDVCGNVVWKHDNLGHHSVHYAEDDTLWVSGEYYLGEDPTGYPNHMAPLRSWTLQNIASDGEILRTIPIFDILMQNGLEGLLYLSNLRNTAPIVRGDTLHLNDIDVFPSNLESSVFEPGDIMFSLRNINGIFVIDPDDLTVKFLSVGAVMRHHDPDFLPGDRISIFDNRNFTLAAEAAPARSRIVEVNAVTGAVDVVLGESEEEEPFFTEIMGNHERLENGNILVVPSGESRLLEYTPDGRLAWEYVNVVDDKKQRIMGAIMLPETQDEAYFDRLTQTCGQ